MLALQSHRLAGKQARDDPNRLIETCRPVRGRRPGQIEHPPLDARLIVEGFRLLPKLVSRLLASPTQAVWLLPTPELRRLAFDARRPTGAPWSFVDRTGDPARALENLVERDRLFTEHLAVEAAELGLHTIRVDVAISTDDVAALVADWFGLR